MNSPAASHPVGLIKKKPILWPLLGIPLGCAIGIVLRNPALGLAIAMFSGMVFLPLNVRMEGRRAKIVLISALLLTLSAVVLAARGDSTLVWGLIGIAATYENFLPRRR